MSFVQFKMALFRCTILISILINKQGIHGQQIGLTSAPSDGKNGLNQVNQSNQGTTQESGIQTQNGNSASKATNVNTLVPVNFQSLDPQSTISAHSTLSLQQPQRISQPANLQITQMPNFQQVFTVQPSLQIEGIYGHQSSLTRAPSVGQNSLNQVHQSNQGTTQESGIQNQNGNSASKATNSNTLVPINFQSLNPQSTISTQPTLSLQLLQRDLQSSNLQLSQIPNLQQTLTVQPSLQLDTSFLQQPSQQSAGIGQQPQNLPQSQNVYRAPVIQQIPCTKQLNPQKSGNLGDYNIQQQAPIVNPVVKQIHVQSSQSIPNAVLISSTPYVSATPSSPCQRRMDNTNNLGANYVPLIARAYSIKETPQTLTSYSTLPKETPQTSTPYSTLPVTAFLSTPTPISLVTHAVMPYGNQAPDIIESPLRISNNFFIEDETKDQNQDNLTPFLLSLLQSPEKSSKSAINSIYPMYSYLSSYLNQGSSSSSIQSLLPLILDILRERRRSCGCCLGCQNNEKKWKNKEDAEPKIYEGYSKKRDYSLREEMFQKDESEEYIPRMIREHKKLKKLKNSIPLDSCEDESAEYDDCSEEDED